MTTPLMLGELFTADDRHRDFRIGLAHVGEAIRVGIAIGYAMEPDVLWGRLVGIRHRGGRHPPVRGPGVPAGRRVVPDGRVPDDVGDRDGAVGWARGAGGEAPSRPVTCPFTLDLT